MWIIYINIFLNTWEIIPLNHFHFLLKKWSSSLNPNKSVGPNSIIRKICKLLKDEISSYFSDICNIYFPMGVFPSVLKTTKVISAHKTDSKLDCNNYGPISLLSNTENFLENLLYSRITKFFHIAQYFFLFYHIPNNF